MFVDILYCNLQHWIFYKNCLTNTIFNGIINQNAMKRKKQDYTCFQRVGGWCESAGGFFASSPWSVLAEKCSRQNGACPLSQGVIIMSRRVAVSIRQKEWYRKIIKSCLFVLRQDCVIFTAVFWKLSVYCTVLFEGIVDLCWLWTKSLTHRWCSKASLQKPLLYILRGLRRVATYT